MSKKQKVEEKERVTNAHGKLPKMDRDYVRKYIAGVLLAVGYTHEKIAETIGIARETFTRSWQYDPIVEKSLAEWQKKLIGEIEPFVPTFIEKLKEIALAQTRRPTPGEQMSAIDRLLSMIGKKPAEKFDLTLNQWSDEDLLKMAKLLGIDAKRPNAESESESDSQNPSNSGDQKETVAK